MPVNSASCVLDSFSRVTGLPPQHLLEAVGHDGIPNGFHTQELITPLVHEGFSVTPIELNPRALNEKGDVWVIQFDGGNRIRFIHHLANGEGVLTGFNAQERPHAVAWKDGKIYDSALAEPYELLKYKYGEPIGFVEGCQFTPICFWKVSRVQG